MAVRPELDAEKRLRELVKQAYDELQRDVAKATTEMERQEKEYGDVLREDMADVCDPLRPGRLRAEPSVTSGLPAGSLAASAQNEQSKKQNITRRQPRREDVSCSEKINEYNDLSMRELADLISDDTFRINSNNNRKLPRRVNKSNAHATPRDQTGTNADALLSRPYRKGPTPAERALLSPQYPGMIQINQISRVNISVTRAQDTRAPADPRRMRLPSREIPGATGAPPETPRTEAGPSSRDTAPVGHTQQPSDRLVEPRPADDGIVPMLKTRTRSRSEARICTTADSSTSVTRISTEKEINVPGSGLRITVSQTKQRLEAADARGLHVAHEEEETVVRKMLVPGGRIGAPSLLGRDTFGKVRGVEPARVDGTAFAGRGARVVMMERRQAPCEVKEGAARVKAREQAVVPGQRLVRQVIQQASSPAPSHPILKRGQEFVPRPPPVTAVRDNARERVLCRAQVGSVSEELEAAYSHVMECNDCSRYLNPLLRKVGAKLVNLPCAASNGRQLQLAAGEASATESDWSEEGRSDADALSTTTRRAVESASCRLLCWDVDRLSEDAAGTPATREPLVIRPRDESCSPICWEMLAPTTDKRAPERQPDARPPATRPGVPPPKPAARELRAAPQHAPKRQLDNRPPTLRSATPPPQPVARELRAEPQGRRIHCCPSCNANATGAAQGRFQEQRGVQPWLPTMEKEFRRMEQLRAPHTDPRFVSDPQQPRMSPAKPRYETIDQATWAAPAQRPQVQPSSAVQQKKNFRFQTGPVDPRPDARSIHTMVNAARPVARVPLVPLQQETDGPRDAARPVVPLQQDYRGSCCPPCDFKFDLVPDRNQRPRAVPLPSPQPAVGRSVFPSIPGGGGHSSFREVPRVDVQPTVGRRVLPIIPVGDRQSSATEVPRIDVQIHVNDKLHQKVRAATRDRALLKNLDLSQGVEISMHAIAKDGRPLGAPACICYKP